VTGPDRSGGEPWTLEGRIARFLDETSQRLWQALPMVLGIGLVFLLATGFYQVNATQIGLVRTLGRLTGQALPGLHYYLPLVQDVERIDVGTTRELRVGSVDRGKDRDQPLFHTESGDLVAVTASVAYRITDVEKYSTRLANQDRGARIAAETALAEVVRGAQRAELLGPGRARIERALHAAVQRHFDAFDGGLVVTEAHVSASLPEGLEPAEADAARARDEAAEIVRRAEGDQLSELSKAKAEAIRERGEATAYASERVLRAQADARRFITVQAEYARTRALTKQRLRLETLERVLSKVQKTTIVDGDAPGASDAKTPSLEKLP
jgi:membrane protease subunit HflK